MLKTSNLPFATLAKTAWQIVQFPLWAGLWAFGLGLLLWYPLRWWPGDQWAAVRLVNYFLPWLLVGLVPGLILAVLGRQQVLALILLLPTLLVSWTYVPLFMPDPPAALAADSSLKVMSYNVWSKNPDLAQAVSLIKKEQPDILLLQEDYRHISPILHPQLSNLYPEGQTYIAYEPGIGQAVISRYPVTPQEVSYKKGRTQKVRVDTPAGPIAVWNVHPHAPIDWLGHYRQLTALVDDIAQVKGPLIVGGDFNTTDQSETYQLVDRHLHNAHWEAGWGFGFTFPAHRPQFKRVPILTAVVRIDHIFYSDHFSVSAAQTLSSAGGSDHLPVTATLDLTVQEASQ